MTDVTIGFMVDGSVTFGFSVGESPAPAPQPSAGLGYLAGEFTADFDGMIKSYEQDEILYGTFTEEE